MQEININLSNGRPRAIAANRCMQFLIVLDKFNIKFKIWRTNKDMGASQHGLF